ncbi:5873_t:CDS:1, partial [Dentiscutata erythropus]
VKEKVYYWHKILKFGANNDEQIKYKDLFENGDKIIQTLSTTSQKHPQAVFSSRLLEYQNLPKPINSNNYG